ncbi:MAG: hypothetical protein HN952_02935 [Candidatus Cloacimonetes bacterium]|jgi:hypothetical protein|nr:hypothetical protein [Candidatus Cloacimonadota bacterium]MBT6993890.1 hypothetical protein [Candidatus Cloacimonadota bacterium]MBT7469796.1 hypothetical protein [Candidatus Cloacimonadota bacterium]
MKKLDINQLININEKRGLPRTYQFKQFIRFFTLFLSILAIGYAVWVILQKVDADSSRFTKMVPFIIIFLALNTVLRNLLTLNAITFTKENIIFKFLAKKKVVIAWNSIHKIVLNDGKHKTIGIHHQNQSENEMKIFEFSMSFPNMLEILNSIAEMCPKAEYDEFIANVILSEEEKK